MSGLRAPTTLFLLLTLLPAAILAWQGWRATEPLIQELQRGAREVASRRATDAAAALPAAAAAAITAARQQLAADAATLRDRLPYDGAAALARLPTHGGLTLRTHGNSLLPAGPDRLRLRHLAEWTRFTAWRTQLDRRGADADLTQQALAFIAPSLRALAVSQAMRAAPELAAAALRDIPRTALAAAGPLPCEVLARSAPGRELLAEGLRDGWLYGVPATERARSSWLAAAGADDAARAQQDCRAAREAGSAMSVIAVPLHAGVDLELACYPLTLLQNVHPETDAVCAIELQPAAMAAPLHWTGPATAALAVDTALGPIAVSATHQGYPALERQALGQRWLTGLGLVLLLSLLTTGLFLVRRALLHEQRARALRDDFIASVSHELKTPLTSLRLHAEMLGDPTLALTERQRYGAVAVAEGARLSALVDDLLDFAALERGQRRLEPEPVDLGAAARAVLDAWRPLAQRDGVAMSVRSDGEALALADPTALSRILGNLVQNAFRHGRPARDAGPSRITLVAKQGRMEVRDNGPGVAAVDRERIFARFARTSRGKGGIGLGLALSRELAHAMGGDLRCDDRQGETVFSLHLPEPPDVVMT